MRDAWKSIGRVVGALWQGLREWCGDAAYEKYRRRTPEAAGNFLSPAQFYVEQLNKKYSRPNRCC
jgi:Selenoprotein, putative